jgi:cell wall-associated NlpC family hydrolase
MNLIRNTLFAVLFLQFLGFVYVKFIHEEENKTIEIPASKTTFINQTKLNKMVSTAVDTVLAQKKPLPISTEYTDNQKKPLVKIATAIPIKIKKKIKKPKAMVKVYKRVNKKIKLSSQIEKYAKKMLGKKYVWGATGPKCYDCSGFTQKVYRKIAGVKLPRVSYLQAKVGKRISFNKLKQGDMVFFDTEKKRTGRVNHVGIYLQHGNFIHASSGGKKVIITNFNKKRFYKNRFLWGRRILKEQENIAMIPSHTEKSL